MIGSLQGKVLKVTSSEILLDVHGVGYLVQAGTQLLSTGIQVGSQIALIVYTDVKENAIQLFGFRDWQEREVFLLTKTVKGIGPRHAMSIVSALGAEGLLQAIGRRDVGKLQSVPGIGKKTAERLLVELREQVGALVTDIHTDALASEIEIQNLGGDALSTRSDIPSGPASDAMLALEKLGFPRERARSAIDAAVREAHTKNVAGDAGEILRLSLSYL